MASVNYKCPNCGGPLKFNPDKQKFSCDFCFSDFDEKTIQELYAREEQKENSDERDEKRAQERAKKAQEAGQTPEEEAVVYHCPSCGAEVVTTASTAATMCFYCQNPVVLGGRLSGEYKPDRVLPFELSREKAIETFMGYCGKKKFLPKDFLSNEQIEKMTGVYFPYWYVDEQKQAHAEAEGKKIRTWTTGNKEYTETSVFNVVRGGDVIIKNVFERALKSQDRDMLNGVHPFDLSKVKPFSMSFLSGFQAEKRDIEKAELENEMERRMNEYAKQLLEDTMEGYSTIKIRDFQEKTDLSSWNYTLLPVWVLTYKYNGQIMPYAINGQTGKLYGGLPVAKGKVWALFAIIAVIVFVIAMLGGLLFL